MSACGCVSLQDEHIINGLFGTVRNVKNLTSAAISRFERHVPLPERNKKCKLHMEVRACASRKALRCAASTMACVWMHGAGTWGHRPSLMHQVGRAVKVGSLCHVIPTDDDAVLVARGLVLRWNRASVST